MPVCFIHFPFLTHPRAPRPQRLGLRPRRGRNRPLCERRRGIGLWKVPPTWKPAAKPARSHSGLEAFGSHTSRSLDGGITYKTLTRGWVLFTLSKRHVSAFSEFAEIEGCVDSFGGPYFRDGIVEKLSRFDQVGQDV